MKKCVCVLLCVFCLFSAAGCGSKEDPAPRVWCLKPSSAAAETELQQLLRNFDADADVSFVPEEDLNMRLRSAMEREDMPDTFMFFTESLSTFASDESLAALDDRIRLSHIKPDELRPAARRACLAQGKMQAVPLFTDVYMLACNRALVPTPPETAEQLLAQKEKLQEKGVALFEKMPPERQSLLFEALLGTHDGTMLNARASEWTFFDASGETSLTDCAALLQDAAEETDAMGMGKAAFSVLTLCERAALSEKFPDAEIELVPLFGLNRMQTVAMGVGKSSKNQKRAFAFVEFLASESERISALYKRYGAQKDVQPIAAQDKDAVPSLAQATPAPAVQGYAPLMRTYLPAAIDKAKKGVPVADCLQEVKENSQPA